MRTVNFRDDVLWAVARRMGYDPAVDLQPDQAAAYTTYINTRVRRLYDELDWPDFIVTEQRLPAPDHTVDFDEANKTPIGRPLRVYLRDPQTATPGGLDTPFRLIGSKIHCGFEHGTNVWVRFLQRAPQFTSVPWSSATAYAPGALAYDPTSGNVYSSAQAGNINHAVTDTGWWALVAFPFVLCDATVRGAYADALREEGQHGKAQAEEQESGEEAVERGAANASQPFYVLTEQARPPARYRPPALGAQR